MENWRVREGIRLWSSAVLTSCLKALFQKGKVFSNPGSHLTAHLQLIWNHTKPQRAQDDLVWRPLTVESREKISCWDSGYPC